MDPESTSIAPTQEPQPTTPAAEQAPVAEGAQGVSDGGPFAAIYNAVPDEHREAVRAAAKEQERKISERFRQAAELEKQWSPFQDLGLTEYEPEALQTALLIADLFDDPSANAERINAEAFRELYDEVGQALGYTQAQQDPGQGDGEPAQDDIPPWAQSLQDQMRPILEAHERQEAERQQAEQQAQIEAAGEAFDQALAELVGEDDELMGLEAEIDGPDGSKVAVKPAQELLDGLAVALIAQGASPQDAAKLAHARVVALRNAIEESLVTSRLEQPKPAVREGGVGVRQSKPRTFDEADAILAERLGTA